MLLTVDRICVGIGGDGGDKIMWAKSGKQVEMGGIPESKLRNYF